MKSFFKRKVRILKWSVPLPLIIAMIFIVGTAAALFYWSSIATTSISAQDGPDVTLSGLSCSISGGGQGTVNECTNGGGSMTVNVSNVNDDSIVLVEFTLTNNDGSFRELLFVPPSPLPDGVSAMTCTEATTPGACDGYMIPGGAGSVDVDVEIALASLTAGQVVPPFNWEVQAHYP